VTVDVERSGGEPVFPLLGRLLIAISLVATLLAAAALARSWHFYHPATPVVAAWLVTVAAVPLFVRRILARRAMTPRAVAGLAVVLLGVDVVVPLTLHPALRATPAAWNWRTGAVLLCLLSAYRPPRDVALFAGMHAGLAVVFAVAAGPVSPTIPVVLVITCAAPSLIAANYLAVYTEGLRSRQAAVDLHLRTSALRATEQAQRQSVLDEVASIRRQIIDLLEAVGAGERTVSEPDVQQEARDLSASLRRELDATRSRGWLFARGGPVVDVLGPASLLDDEARVSVAALVELLSRHPGMRNIVVTVGTEPVARTRPDGPDGPHGPECAVEVTIVASGPASAEASADPAILAAADGLGTAVWHDPEAENLVVEAQVPVGGLSPGSADDARRRMTD
jgi:hypothetical protein